MAEGDGVKLAVGELLAHLDGVEMLDSALPDTATVHPRPVKLAYVHGIVPDRRLFRTSKLLGGKAEAHRRRTKVTGEAHT